MALAISDEVKLATLRLLRGANGICLGGSNGGFKPTRQLPKQWLMSLGSRAFLATKESFYRRMHDPVGRVAANSQHVELGTVMRCYANRTGLAAYQGRRYEPILCDYADHPNCRGRTQFR